MFDIAKRFKEIRLNMDLSANKLAKLLNVDPSTISKIENSSAKPSIDLIQNLCSTAQITLNEFFNDSDQEEYSLEALNLMKDIKLLNDSQVAAIHELVKVFK